MTNTQKVIESYENKVRALLQENFELFTENTKLKNSINTKVPKKTNRTTIRNRGNRSTKAERELNKQIVLNECMKNTSINEIAKKINKSVPTVRIYISELKKSKLM